MQLDSADGQDMESLSSLSPLHMTSLKQAITSPKLALAHILSNKREAKGKYFLEIEVN